MIHILHFVVSTVFLLGLALSHSVPHAVGNDSVKGRADSKTGFQQTIELAAVCESPQQDFGWWDLDGKALDQPPELSAARPAKKTLSGMQPDEISRLVVIRARVAPTARVDCKIAGQKWAIRVPEQADGRDWKALKNAAEERGEPFHADEFEWIEYSIGVQVVCPKEQAATNARISVADGPWETVSVRARRPGDGQTLQFDLGRIGKEGVEALLPQTAEKQVRVMAEDKQGELHAAASSFVVSGEFGTALKVHARFSLPVADIKAYHLQARPYEFYQLSGIPLYPANLPAVRRVRLWGGSFGGDRNLLGERQVNETPRDLDWMNAVDQQLALIHRIPSLRRVYVAGETITDQGAKAIAEMRQLQHVAINSPQLTPACLENFATSQATSIELMGEGLNSVPAHHLAQIAKAANLVELKLWDTELSDAGAEAICSAGKLKVLHARGSQLTDAGLKALTQLTELRELHLGDTKCGDAGFASLARLKKLRVLDVQGAKVSDKGVRSLAELPHLRSLNLAGMNLTDDCFQFLAKLSSLELLDLRDTGCTREGWKSMGESRLPRTYLPDPPHRDVEVRVTVQDATGEAAVGTHVYLLTAQSVFRRANMIGNPSLSLPELDRGQTDRRGEAVLHFNTARSQDWLMLWAISPQGEPAVVTLQTPLHQPVVSKKLAFQSGELTYHLIDSKGRPAAGVKVFPLRVGRDVPASLVDSALTRTTDQAGRVVLRGMTGDDITNLAFFSTAFGNQATGWERDGLADGSTIQLSPTGTLKGIILCDDPVDLTDLKGIVYTRERQTKHSTADIVTRHSWAELRPGPDGRFQIEHLSPDWALFSDRTESNEARLDWQPIEVAADKTTVAEQRAIQPVRIQGRIRVMHDWGAAANFSLSVRSGHRAGDWTWKQEVTTDGSGRFSALVMPGKADLYVNRFYQGKYRSIEHWLWRGDRFGGDWNISDEFAVRYIEPIDLARLVEKTGTLVDDEGDPIASGIVYGFPAPLDAEVTNCVGAHTRDDGTFKMLYPATHPPVAFRGSDRDGEYIVKQKEPLILIDQTQP